jgi:hypothetical protein
MSENLELEAARAALDQTIYQRRISDAAAAVLRHHLSRIAALLDGCGSLHPNVHRAAQIARYAPADHDAGEAFLAHLARLEAQVIGAGQGAPAVDCRLVGCKWHNGGGCTNTAPAITLGEDGAAHCWSREDRGE